MNKDKVMIKKKDALQHDWKHRVKDKPFEECLQIIEGAVRTCTNYLDELKHIVLDITIDPSFKRCSVLWYWGYIMSGDRSKEPSKILFRFTIEKNADRINVNYLYCNGDFPSV